MTSTTITAAISAPLPTKRGRPRVNDPIGPTEQTLAKLQADTLGMLTDLRIITKDEASAGREILDAWEIITAAVDICSGNGGRTEIDGGRSAWLQEVWRAWAAPAPGRSGGELFHRTKVRPGKVVQWIGDSASCDIDPKGAAGVLREALRCWQWATASVAALRAQQANDARAA